MSRTDPLATADKPLTEPGWVPTDVALDEHNGGEWERAADKPLTQKQIAAILLPSILNSGIPHVGHNQLCHEADAKVIEAVLAADKPLTGRDGQTVPAEDFAALVSQRDAAEDTVIRLRAELRGLRAATPTAPALDVERAIAELLGVESALDTTRERLRKVMPLLQAAALSPTTETPK